ncbi:MAG: endolytic transglycosylase MltG [Ancalomicrobiaceae bacterium]|nr:endolytic transglycosylase MltG [Ancalomicrobiaceae bacterium]
MPPPPPFISPPPPPPPSQPPRLPFGDVGPGSRKPLVARKRLREQLHPIASEIQPGESGRRKRLLRSRAARSSVVVVFDGLMSLAAVAAAALGITAIAGRQEFELPGPLVAAKVVEVPAKRSLDDIGDTLERAGVVSDSTTFVWGARIAQIADLKAGEYEFKAHATMRDVAEELQQGKVIQHKITFPEGWTSEQVVQRLLDETRLAGKIAAIPEEGSLLPETYLFPKGDNREHVLDQMRRAQDRRLTEIWAHRNADALKMLKVPRDLVILASIVEKETGKADERARVAGVFVNRLNRGMRLETDPTILYGLYGGKAWLEPRVISKADLAAPNPYNTYKINGLPPGPIGNPGRAAMEAVANPAVSNELFFVADGSGGHLFSETVEEHNKNVARWREIEKQRHAGDPNAPMNPGGIGILNLTPTPAASIPAAATTKPTSQRPAAQKRLRGAVQPRPDSPANPN